MTNPQPPAANARPSILHSAAALIVVLTATTLGGCGGNSQPSKDPAEPGPVVADTPRQSRPAPAPKVSVAKAGYSYDPDESFGTMTVTALVNNPSNEKVIVTVDFTAYDKAGEVLAQQTQNMVLGASRTGATGTVLEVGEGVEVGRVTAEPDVTEHEPDDHPGSVLVPSEVKFHADAYGSTRVTGKITNKFQSNLRSYRLDAVCYKGGTIIGGGFTYPNSLHRSGTVRAADVDVFVTGKPDRCELYGGVDLGTETETE